MIFNADWGHAREGSTDSYLARPSIVQEAIRQHRLGAIVTICWHAVPPTAEEPVTFWRRVNAVQDALASVQGQLTDSQFREGFTPGTDLYKRWCRQVDLIAALEAVSRNERELVLVGWPIWRVQCQALYRQLFDRFVNHHKINNLIWVWSVDRPVNPWMPNLNGFFM